MTVANTMTLAIMIFSVAILIAVIGAAIIFLSDRAKSIKVQLNTSVDVRKISPKLINFLFSWYVYMLFFLLPLFIVDWLLMGNADAIVIGLFVGVVLTGLLTIQAYPYYTILLGKESLSGPTFWNWKWRREEIPLGEIDKEKTLQRNIGRKLGIVVFYAFDGKKILSLGLNEIQINQILTLASEVSAVK